MSLRAWLNAVRSAHRFLFERHLLVTNTAICGASCLLADAALQRVSSRRRDAPSVNWARSGRLGAVGLALGPLCHFWYGWLDRRFTGSAVRAVLVKLAFDTVIFAPAYILAYHAALLAIDNGSLEDLGKMLRSSGLSLFSIEGATAPLQALNFFFVPSRFRVLCDNTLSFSLDMTYSHFVHKEFVDDSES